MKAPTVLALLTLICSSVHSYKILGLFPYHGKSHFLVFEKLMLALAEKGHDVTVISHFPQKTPVPRYTDIQLIDNPELYVNVVDINLVTGARWQKYICPYMLANMTDANCEEGLRSQVLQNFLKRNEKFDVILAEFFNTECFLGIVHKLKAPLVAFSSSIIMPWAYERFGAPNNPSYIPNHFMDYSDRLSFFERVENLIMNGLSNLVFHFFIDKPGNEIAKRHLGDDLPSLSEIAYNTSLYLVNTHFTLNLPKAEVPSIIEVGGIHVGKPKKLPQNIEKWISESTEGVIYFSLGSMIKGHTFPEEKRQMFLRAFGRLPQRVLWKWENETMPGQPDNVMIQKWMPQFDILCHPNVKAFVSHSGLLGMIEAVHCGVPVIAMPQFGDQHTNAKALEASGGGVILNFREADEEMIYSALTTVLKPSFNKKAKELSARFKDRPLPPLDTAVYWVEYVARHGGAPHMRTAAVGMPLYQYLLLDVIAFIMAVVVVIALVAYYITRAMLRKLFGKSNKVKTN